MESVTQVQIQNETVGISLHANALGDWYDSVCSPSNYT